MSKKKKKAQPRVRTIIDEQGIKRTVVRSVVITSVHRLPEDVTT